MANYDFEGEFSDSDTDDVLLRDIQALSSACMPCSTIPKSNSIATATINDVNENGHVDATQDGRACATAAESSDSDDDFELLRDIKKNYAHDSDISQPLTLKPITTLPPSISSDDDEDDFETLRAIQWRFSRYCSDTAVNNKSSHTYKKQGHDVGISSEDEVLYRGLVKGIDANEDACGVSQKSEALGNILSRDKERCSFDYNQSVVGSACGLQIQNSSLPKSALLFVDAIKKNRACQKLLRSKIIHVEARIEAVKELKKRVKILKEFQQQCKKKVGRVLSKKQDARVQLISASKPSANSKDNGKGVLAMSYGPLENSHIANYRMALTLFPQSFQRDKWTMEEKENLKKGIMQQFQEMLLQNLLYEVSSSEAPRYLDELDDIMSSIRDVEVTPEKMRIFLPKVNWEQLASMYVPRRSGAECEARWLNFEDGLINHAEWTTLEDKKLLLILQEKGLNNWIDISVSLQTNRTPFRCLARYQRSLNSSILKRDWTVDEDALLQSAVEEFGESNWQAVASALEGRTGPQCSNRWRKSLHPTIERKGNWTQDEDKCLKVAVTVIGPKSWHKIAQFVPGRTQVQCRERWVNCLDPSLITGGWTEEDDLKLQAAIAEHGYCWARVAACLPPRTDNQCRRRWKVLFPHEVPLLQAARDIQRTALISNFVDRESLRPSLGPKDFIALPHPNSMPGVVNVKQRKLRGRTEADKIEVTAFLNIPRKLRSRRCRRKVVEEFPVVRECNVVKTIGEDDTLSNKQKMVNKSSSKKNKCAELWRDYSSHFDSRFSSGGKEAELSDVVVMFGEDDTLANNRRRSGQLHSKRKMHPDESEEWDHLSLADLFGEAVMHLKKKKFFSVR